MAKTYPDQPETPADIGKIRRMVNGPALPTVTVRPSYAQRFATGSLGPTTASQAFAALAPEIAARQQAALTTASAPPPAPPAPPRNFDSFAGTPPTYPYGPGHGLARLAPGVSRYALGGDIAGPNATPIYTTRGKNGEAVFTDNAGYAAAQSTGKLRRGEVNADVYANAQENAKTNPNAGYEFAPSTLNTRGVQLTGVDANGNPVTRSTGGLRREDFQTLDPGATEAALAVAQGGIDNSEQGLANRMDASLLRARKITQGQQASDGMQSLDPRTQIALMRAQTAAAQGAERNAIARGTLEETTRARDTAEKNSARQADNDAFNQYLTLQQKNPAQANDWLAGQIDSHAKSGSDADFQKWANSPGGTQLLNAYLTNVLQPGAENSLGFLEWGDKRNVPKINYNDIALNDSGSFAGLINATDTVRGETPKVEYPANAALLRSWLGRTPNYDASVNRLTPVTLKRLKNLGLNNAR